MVTHLGLTEEQRRRQAEQLLEHTRSLNGRPVVLTGDFNGSPGSPEVRLLSEGLHDALSRLPEEERVTFPSGDPEMHGRDFLARTIDYIFVSGHAQVTEAAVIADYSLASDHNPCEATVLIS
jgi:endonuclease/exonuclease/phosphatase family metal-dependent hydrolase